jgi:hypothetical protein
LVAGATAAATGAADFADLTGILKVVGVFGFGWWGGFGERAVLLLFLYRVWNFFSARSLFRSFVANIFFSPS